MNTYSLKHSINNNNKRFGLAKVEKAASTTLAIVAARTAIAYAERTKTNTTREDGAQVPRI